MGRLMVSAVPNESSNVDVVGHLLIFVSVSRASDGQPVTGLGRDNFRIAPAAGDVLDPQPVVVSEVEWESPNGEASGCYRVSISRGRLVPGEPGNLLTWVPGETYALGIQVRVFELHQIDGQGIEVPVDFGQMVLQVVSLGT